MCVSVGLYTSLYEAEQPALLCQLCVSKLSLTQRHFLDAGNSRDWLTTALHETDFSPNHASFNPRLHKLTSYSKAASISLWHKGIYPLYRQAIKGENKT